MLIEKIATVLLQDTTREKIIILQGDHGFRDFENGVSPKEEFENFNAIYFYTRKYDKIATNPGMVNVFRIVLNEFFKTDLPMLADSIVLGRN